MVMGFPPFWRLPQHLQTRFRVATLMLVIPLVAVGAVGAVGAVVSVRATSVLTAQSDDSAQIQALQVQVQDVALDGMAFMATGQIDQLSAMWASEGAVESALVRLAAWPTLGAGERPPGLAGAEQAWDASLIARNEVETLPTAINTALDTSSVAFYFSYVISDVSSQLQSAPRPAAPKWSRSRRNSRMIRRPGRRPSWPRSSSTCCGRSGPPAG
jgi:hypothetical protein